jgi:hypothetical protein
VFLTNTTPKITVVPCDLKEHLRVQSSRSTLQSLKAVTAGLLSLQVPEQHRLDVQRDYPKEPR